MHAFEYSAFEMIVRETTENQSLKDMFSLEPRRGEAVREIVGYLFVLLVKE